MPVAELPQLLDEEKTAKVLGVKTQTLANWRSTRRVPLPFVKIGRAVRYRIEDIEKFLADHTSGGVKN